MTDETKPRDKSATQIPTVEIQLEREELEHPLKFEVLYTMRVVIRLKPRPYLLSV